MCKSCKTCSNAVKNEFESHDNANVDKKNGKNLLTCKLFAKRSLSMNHDSAQWQG